MSLSDFLARFTKNFTRAPEPNPADAEEIAEEILGHCGRRMSLSRLQEEGTYSNANVCTSAGKIWYGDIDVRDYRTLAKLDQLAEALSREVYVLRERDGRFENHDKPLLGKAVLVVHARPESERTSPNPQGTWQETVDADKPTSGGYEAASPNATPPPPRAAPTVERRDAAMLQTPIEAPLGGVMVAGIGAITGQLYVRSHGVGHHVHVEAAYAETDDFHEVQGSPLLRADGQTHYDSHDAICAHLATDPGDLDGDGNADPADLSGLTEI